MKRHSYLLLAAIILLASCGQNANDYSATGHEKEMLADVAESYAMAPRAAGKMLANTGDKKVVKSASLGYEVHELETAVQALNDLLTEYKGVITEDRRYESGNRRTCRMSLQIPAASFENFLNALAERSEIRKVSYQTISAEDVTEHHIDLSSRLETKKSFLKRYRSLLEKAESVQDIMAVEEKIRRLEEEINSGEKQLEYLNRQINMAGLNLELYEITTPDYISEKQNTFVYLLKSALSNGLQGVITVFFWLIGIWPIWAVALLIVLISKFRNNKKDAS